MWVPPAAEICFGGEARDTAELCLLSARQCDSPGLCQFLRGANLPEEQLRLQGDDTQLSPSV